MQLNFPSSYSLYRIACMGALCRFVLLLLDPVLSTRKLLLINEIDAPKENQCMGTTAWLFNGFLSKEIFKVPKRKKVPATYLKRLFKVNSVFLFGISFFFVLEIFTFLYYSNMQQLLLLLLLLERRTILANNFKDILFAPSVGPGLPSRITGEAPCRV